MYEKDIFVSYLIWIEVSYCRDLIRYEKIYLYIFILYLFIEM